jgi:hypothetical protein
MHEKLQSIITQLSYLNKNLQKLETQHFIIFKYIQNLNYFFR